MPRFLRFGVVRFASVAQAIARELAVEVEPDCHLGRGRMTITFRNIGATRWPVGEQAERALAAAATARRLLAEDPRARVHRRASRAIVVAYEDETLVRGCAVSARWSCVVPAARPV